jgi:hypothetical protein
MCVVNADEEILALWRETFGGPTPVTADAAMLSELLVRHLQLAPPYRPRPPEAPPRRL